MLKLSITKNYNSHWSNMKSVFWVLFKQCQSSIKLSLNRKYWINLCTYVQLTIIQMNIKLTWCQPKHLIEMFDKHIFLFLLVCNHFDAPHWAFLCTIFNHARIILLLISFYDLNNLDFKIYSINLNTEIRMSIVCAMLLLSFHRT